MAKTTLLILAAFVLGLVFTVSAKAGDREKIDPVLLNIGSFSETTNLLTNPSFEGDYKPYVPLGGHPDCPTGICQTANMASGWTPWWVKIRQTDVNPEYKPAELWHTNPDRVRSGSRAQQYFSFSTTHEAGFYQRVPVQVGEEYCFSIWGHGWSANDNDDAYSGPEDGWLDQKVGIDPTGGTNPQSGDVIWGPPRLQYDEYGYFSISASAGSSFLTVFTFSRPIYPVKHNDVYWDDASLVQVNSDGVLTVQPSTGLIFLAQASSPQMMTKTLRVNLPEDSCLTWNASIENQGSISMTSVPLQGGPGSEVLVTIDSAGLLPGSYAADIKFEANLNLQNSPLTIPVVLEVLNDLDPIYIPVLTND